MTTSNKAKSNNSATPVPDDSINDTLAHLTVEDDVQGAVGGITVDPVASVSHSSGSAAMIDSTGLASSIVSSRSSLRHPGEDLSLMRRLGTHSRPGAAGQTVEDRNRTESVVRLSPAVAPKPRTTSIAGPVSVTAPPPPPLPKTESAVTSKPAKKRLKFWSFLKRGRRTPTLPQCAETGEDETNVQLAEAGGCFSRSGLCGMNGTEQSDATAMSMPHAHSRRRGSPTPDSPSGARNLRHLSFGAGSRSFRFFADAHLMTVVVPAPPLQMLNDVDIREAPVHVDLRDLAVAADSSLNPTGYPHLHFSQSMSSSSSSSSSGISAPLAPAPPTPDYPPFSVTPTVHTQVDYMHCLVPDLLELTNRVFYWGVMDRYEAERLLDGRPEGTFLVRDSAQEEFLFSVSFRRYGRSLHARIEQWNHRFSFDSHDLGVFAAPSVCALVEHYKDPAACMFFEPMLTLPLARTYAFTLQHLCRAVICSRVSYDDISSLRLPHRLQDYLKYYHYKQRICVRRFEAHCKLAD